jgi:hypothetical protein
MFTQENASVDYIRILITVQQLGHKLQKIPSRISNQTRDRAEGGKGSLYTIFVNKNERT